MLPASLIAAPEGAVSASAISPPQAHAPRSLDEAFQAALKRSESFAIQNEALEQSEERYDQARGSVLPTINAQASQTWQEPNTSGVGSSLFPSSQPLVKLTATQPLFRGLREFAGIRAAADQVETQKEQRRLAATQLFLEVSQNFYSVLSVERELKIIAAQVELFGKRVGELRSRRQIGRSRLSEELSTEAAMSALRAQAESLGGQLKSLRETLGSLTGLGQDVALQDPQESAFAEGAVPLPLEEYLRGVEERPDVKVEKSRQAAAEESRVIARGAHLPSADLSGNYYLKRSGSLKDVSWDVQLGMTLPLYSGGVLSSKVREAASQARQAELALARARRLGEQEVRSLYEIVRSDRKQIQALQEAVALSERNYAAQSADYRHGTVSNLEVLQAMTSFQESRRALDRVRFAAKQNFIRLETAAARRPGRLIGEPAPAGAW